MITKKDIKERLSEEIDKLMENYTDEFTEGVRLDGKAYYEGKTVDGYGVRFNIIVKNAVYELATPKKE